MICGVAANHWKRAHSNHRKQVISNKGLCQTTFNECLALVNVPTITHTTCKYTAKCGNYIGTHRIFICHMICHVSLIKTFPHVNYVIGERRWVRACMCVFVFVFVFVFVCMWCVGLWTMECGMYTEHIGNSYGLRHCDFNPNMDLDMQYLLVVFLLFSIFISNRSLSISIPKVIPIEAMVGIKKVFLNCNLLRSIYFIHSLNQYRIFCFFPSTDRVCVCSINWWTNQPISNYISDTNVFCVYSSIWAFVDCYNWTRLSDWVHSVKQSPQYTSKYFTSHKSSRLICTLRYVALHVHHILNSQSIDYYLLVQPHFRPNLGHLCILGSYFGLSTTNKCVLIHPVPFRFHSIRSDLLIYFSTGEFGR